MYFSAAQAACKLFVLFYFMIFAMHKHIFHIIKVHYLFGGVFLVARTKFIAEVCNLVTAAKKRSCFAKPARDYGRHHCFVLPYPCCFVYSYNINRFC